MSDLFSFETCDQCGEEYPSGDMKTHDSKRLCRKCFRIVNPPKPRTKREEKGDVFPTKDSTVLVPESSAGRIASIEFSQESITSIAGAISGSLVSVFSQPIKIELAPVKLELVGGGTTVPVQQRGDHEHGRGQATGTQDVSKMDVKVHPPQTAHVNDLDTIVLKVMGASTRRQKWRPVELHADIGIHYADLPVTVDEVASSLERLSKPVEGTPSSGHVVKLSTRFIRGDYFTVTDELEYIDILILKVLEHGSANGLPATIIHECIRLLNLELVSQPTVLNHLRMLRSPGWDILEKSGDGFRDPYKITSNGAGILGDSLDAFIGMHDYTGEWKARFARWDVITGDGKPTARASIFMDPLRDIVVKRAMITDKQFIIAFIEDKLDEAALEQHARTVTALEYMGIGFSRKKNDD